MKVSVDRLRSCASAMIQFLDGEGVRGVGDLKERLGDVSDVGASGDKININLRLSNGGTQAVSFNYFSPEVGFIVDARINTALGYSQIILKYDGEVNGYEVFARDRSDNLAQVLRLERSSLEGVREEIEKLSAKI